MLHKLLWVALPPALAILCGLAVNSALRTDGYSITLSVGHERIDPRLGALADDIQKRTVALKVARAR
jgi:hypothetical protein